MDEVNIDNAILKDGFAGDRRYLKGFLAKINLIFLLYPDRYPDDTTKVIYLISRLYGNAMNWAATLIERSDPCLNDYQAFTSKLKSFYGDNDASYVANQMLKRIKQKSLGGIRGYISEFNKYADESNWNEEAKMDAFIDGLHQQVALKVLELFPGPRDLISLQTIASRIDSRLSAKRTFFDSNNNNNSTRKKNNYRKTYNKDNSQAKYHGPLSNEEKERRKKNNLCLYCGSSKHKLDSCPKRTKKPTEKTSFMSVPTTVPTQNERSNNRRNEQATSNFKLSYELDTEVLIDTGSALNLIDVDYCNDHNIPYSCDEELPKILGIGGRQALFGITKPLNLRYKDHLCRTQFYVTDLPYYHCILGLDWLREHNPDIDFTNNKISFVSEHCLTYCVTLPTNVPEFPEENSAFPRIENNSTQNNEITTLPVFLETEKETSCKSSSQESKTKTENPKDKSSKEILTTKESLIQLAFLVSQEILPKELIEFIDVFSETSAEKLPPHRPYDCQINLIENARLFYGPIYPLTELESRILKEYIEENLKKGFIRKSKSPAGAPVLFVPKKNGELRLCQDYRELNKITIRDSYPLPLIQDMLEHLGKGKIFSKLDLRSAYNLVRIKEGDEYKTAFTCKYGHFEYLVMPFGLKNAPAVFQHFINDVFEDIIGDFVYAYIDDIIIFSLDKESHIIHVKEALSRLRHAGLYAKLEKCQFFVSSIDFLGHRISSEGLSMDPNKVSSVVNWPVPTNVKELQSFLGLANYYRRFILGFAKLCQPLHHLLRKNVTFNWSSEAQSAFNTLKSKFSSYPVLVHPNRELPFIVETDSSNFAIGAVLSQKSLSDNHIHPVAFYSRSLSPTERNYPIYDKELLAIISALENWRHFLKGASEPFVIYSDHRNLLFQKKPEKMTQRLVRWSLFLSEFNFKILYRSGSSNGKPDALSRRPDYIPCSNTSDNSQFSVLRPENFCTLICSNTSLYNDILSDYKNDSFYSDICNYLESKKPPVPHQHIDKFSLSNGFLLFNNKIYTPPNCRSSVIKICHDSPSAGHFGIRKTTSLISRDFWWPYISSDVKDYIRSCDICCRAKSSRHKPYGFLHPLEISDRPWSSISMDFITDLPNSEGYNCILVVVDRLTKMIHLFPFNNIPSASETASVFLNNIFKLHGFPSEIISDRGTQFTSKFWKSLCKSFNIDLKFSSPYHHQSNGQTERVNSVIEQYLRCFTNYKGTNWNQFLCLAEFSYNNSLQDSTGFSPFYLNYGYHPRHSPVIPDQTCIPRTEEMTKDFVDLNKKLKENLKKAIETQKLQADKRRSKPPEFKTGDKVWLDSSLIIHKGNKKFKPRKLGPYKILEKISEVSYKLELPKTIKIHPVVHVSSLEPYYEDRFNRNPPAPPPIIINDEQEYEVEEILDKRKYYGKTQYLIKWKGYPISEASWEPVENLNCDQLLKEFNKK